MRTLIRILIAALFGLCVYVPTGSGQGPNKRRHAKLRESLRTCAIALTLCLVLPALCSAQGSRHDDIVLNRFGQPVAGASITVCTSGATGSPCSPLANVYLDLGLTQPLTNPFTSDGQGNYYFYAAPGRYLIQISGAGVSTTTIPDVLLPADPTSPSYQSLSVSQNINALNLNLSGNLTVSGGVSSPTTVSAPQQGSSGPVQLGTRWSPGTATGLCQAPAAPTVTTETVSSGTGNFTSGTTYYVQVRLGNMNGWTPPSSSTSYTPASGSTNRMLVQLSDYSYRSGCYKYQVQVATSAGGPFYPAQAWTLPAASIASWTRNSAGLVTVTTSSGHGFIPGEYVTISGAATGTNGTNINSGGSNPAGWTLIAQQGSSPTKFFFLQSASLGADSSSTAQGTGTVIAGLGADFYSHMAPGDFIVATVPASGSAFANTNTAAVDPDQVALNATCNFAANTCALGRYDVPQGSITKTTPLIVSNQETVTGVNTGGAGGKSSLNCAAITDLNLGCIMVMGTANGVRISGLDIQAACNGIMVTGWGPGFGSSNSFFTNNNINVTSLAGTCAAVRYHEGTWYEHHWDGNFLNSDLADVIFEGVSGGITTFANARWNAANLSASGLSTNGFLSVSAVTDPDRAQNRGAFPDASGLTTFSNFYLEQGTGIQFECVNVACKLVNVQSADSATISGTPAAFRYGCDANAGAAVWNPGTIIEDSYIGAGTATGIQAIAAGTCMPLTVRNTYLGATNDLDLNSNGGTVNISDSLTQPWEGSTTHKIINAATTSSISVRSTAFDGTSNSGWALHQVVGGTRFLAPNQGNSPDLYFEPYNYNSFQAGGFWFAGSPGTSTNLFMDYGVSGRPNFSLLDSSGNTM
ncbi:MAG TPA: carboxypeptidase-like regulatory domain-containing protein, partial [Candidatus Acidoferrales bacterium]|nr:carboxypeptidase-like regulatory domain-containing protein [Candidatus Acidoferrales bacterium]